MNNINLADFFQKRKEQEEQLKKDLEIKAKQVNDLIPVAARGYTNEAMFHVDKWLLNLYSNTLAGTCNSDKIRNLSDYHFTSQEDAKTKLKLLQDAWKDEIEVKIIDGNCITVEFRLIGAVN